MAKVGTLCYPRARKKKPDPRRTFSFLLVSKNSPLTPLVRGELFKKRIFLFKFLFPPLKEGIKGGLSKYYFATNVAHAPKPDGQGAHS
jgi:hypothetical protein